MSCRQDRLMSLMVQFLCFDVLGLHAVTSLKQTDVK